MTEARKLISCANRLGEAIIWHRDTSRLMWLDLLNVQLFVHDPGSGETEHHALQLQSPLGALVATTDPNTVIVSHRCGIVTYDIRNQVVAPFSDPEAGRDAVAYNDGKVDRYGRLWVGTSHLDEREARGALWCVEPDGTGTLGDAGFVVSNGPAFSPDGNKLYFNDTLARQTLQYDISATDPHPRNRKVLVTYAAEEGYPDGVTVDAEGCVWVAHWAGARITRFSPTGERKQVFTVPVPNVTSICFGGDDLCTLFVTTAWEGTPDRAAYPYAGDVFALNPGVRGVAEPHFHCSWNA